MSRAARLALGLALGLLALKGLASSLPGEALWDFGSFVASGRAAAEGQNPYGIYPLTFRVVMPGFESWNPNLNPPVSALLFQAFDLVDPRLGFRIWWGVSVACHAAAVALLVRHFDPPHPWLWALWAFTLAGFWDTLVLGQIYVPLVLAGAAAWVALDRGAAIRAGVLIGVVVAMKPNFLVWPAVLFLAGHRRAALASVAAAAALSALPLAAYGVEVYRQWIELVASDRERGVFLTNVSLFGVAARAGAPGLGPWLGLALLGGLALWAWRSRPPLALASGAGIAGALLASPVAWVHDTLFLVPVALALGPRPGVLVAAAALSIPVPLVLGLTDAPAWVRASAGSVYGWATVLWLVLVLARARAGVPSAPRVPARA
jgi:hypothetical protein